VGTQNIPRNSAITQGPRDALRHLTRWNTETVPAPQDRGMFVVVVQRVQSCLYDARKSHCSTLKLKIGKIWEFRSSRVTEYIKSDYICRVSVHRGSTLACQTGHDRLRGWYRSPSIIAKLVELVVPRGPRIYPSW